MPTETSPFDKKLNGEPPSKGKTPKMGTTSEKQIRLQIAKINRALDRPDITVDQQIELMKLHANARKDLDAVVQRKRERKAQAISRSSDKSFVFTDR